MVTSADTRSYMRKFWSRVAMTGGARIFVLFSSLLTLVITARAFGPAGRGAIAAVMTWTALFVTCGHLSLGQVAIHKATNASDQNWLGPTLSTLIVTCAGVTILSWMIVALMFVGSNAFAHLTLLWIVIGFAALPFQIWEVFGSSILMALDRIELYNRMQFMGRSAGLILLVAVIAAGYGVTGALAAMVITQILTASAGWRTIWGLAGQRLHFDQATFRDLFSGSAKLHLSAIGFYLTTHADVLILNYYRGTAATGEYQLATQLTFAILMMPQAAAAVLYGTISRFGKIEGWTYQRWILLWMTGAMTAAAIIGWLFAPLIIRLFAGSAFLPAVAPFRILLISLVGMTMMTVMSPQWTARGLFLSSSVLTIVAGIANIAASFAFTPTYGMYAPAWASAITYTVLGLVSIGLAIRCEIDLRHARDGTVGMTGVSESGAAR